MKKLVKKIGIVMLLAITAYIVAMTAASSGITKDVNVTNLGQEILLKSRRFVPAKGINAAEKSRIQNRFCHCVHSKF